MKKKLNGNIYAGYWIRRFLCGYLTDIRNLSINTVKAYRNAIRMLVSFICEKKHIAADRILITDITQQIVIDMLDSLEKDRGSSVKTRNLRLSAFVALAKFVATRCPEYIDWCRKIREIPVKKAPGKLSLIWRRTKWTPCSTCQTRTPNRDGVTTYSFSSSTILAQGQKRLRRYKSAT